MYDNTELKNAKVTVVVSFQNTATQDCYYFICQFIKEITYPLMEEYWIYTMWGVWVFTEGQGHTTHH